MGVTPTLQPRFRELLKRTLASLSLVAVAASSALIGVVVAPVPDAAHAVLGTAAKKSEQVCDSGVNATDPAAKQVNLVLDDSGSMFLNDDGSVNQSWSAAKYSVEVFAAMLGPKDSLSVFRTSDFGDGAHSGPAVQISGSTPLSDRVGRVHSMQLVGGGTPYAPISQAVADLRGGSAPEKWLVVLSDGEFDDRATGDVQLDLQRFVAENTTDKSALNVAFLALGSAAPMLQDNPAGGVSFAHAPDASKLLGTMTDFSNRIFGRSLLPQASPGQANIDIDMDEVMVFAQGEGVKIEGLRTIDGVIKAASAVDVSWIDNQAALSDGVSVSAVPNKGLQGKLAVFENVPAGTITAEVTGAKAVDMFYKPRVAFGIELTDSQGERVESGKIVGGEYTVNYGFMNKQCEFIESSLFGEPTFQAQMTNGDASVSFTPGDKITLERGPAQFDVSAMFLERSTSRAVIDLNVLRPPKPTYFEGGGDTFLASRLGGVGTPDDAMELHYGIEEAGKRSDFSAEEWASFKPDAFSVTSSKPSIDFRVEVGAQPGQLLVWPIAPGGDRYAVATGEIPITVTASHVFDEQLIEGEGETSLIVEDDISFFERLLNWFTTVGWMWLLLLLLIVWVLGYFTRKRLPRQLKARPLVDFRPKGLGGKRAQFDARYEKQRGRSLLPYLPETGVIRPPAQVRGVPPLKVKAAGSGRMEVLNWKAFATSGKVSFDGEQLTKETQKVRPLRGTSTITVASNDGNYDIQLSQTRSPGKRK